MQGTRKLSGYHISSVTKSSGDQDSGCITSLALVKKLAPPMKVKLLLHALRGHRNSVLWSQVYFYSRNIER